MNLRSFFLRNPVGWVMHRMLVGILVAGFSHAFQPIGVSAAQGVGGVIRPAIEASGEGKSTLNERPTPVVEPSAGGIAVKPVASFDSAPGKRLEIRLNPLSVASPQPVRPMRELLEEDALPISSPSDPSCFELVARPKPGKVDLSWLPVSGAQGYAVYRGTDADPVLFRQRATVSPSATVFVDQAVANETTYLYFVRPLPEGLGCDSLVAAAHPTVDRRPGNQSPVIYSDPRSAGAEGESFTHRVRAADPFPADSLQYQLLAGPEGMLLDPDTGLLTWTTTPGSHDVQVQVADGRGGSDRQDFVLEVPGDNARPIANAGPDRTLAVGSLVTLDGSGSTDTDGDRLTYVWSLVTRPATSQAILSDATSVQPQFTLDAAGSYEMELVVHDGQVASDPDVVVIDTSNSAPVADAGPDRTVAVGVVAELDGTGSRDDDEDPLTFHWTVVAKPTGSLAELSDPSLDRPQLLIDLPGAYQIELVVQDPYQSSEPDRVTLDTRNSRPVANAGPDQTVTLGDQVSLDGSGSQDADQDDLTWQWSILHAPEGSLVTLSEDTIPTPTLEADQVGLMVVQLMVHDGWQSSLPDTLVIKVEPSWVIVPDVVGLTETAAAAKVEAATLVVGPISSATSPVVPSGHVLFQHPTAGTQVRSGSEVALTLSLGPPKVLVPDVVGLPQEIAETTLQSANLVAGDLTAIHHPSVPVGHVISQDPVARTAVFPGTPVDLVLSLGVPIDCIFSEDQWSDWWITVAPVPEGGVPGSVRPASLPECAAIMTEGDSFLTAMERAFPVPDPGGLLVLVVEGPQFDSSAMGAMRDAFEVAIVDASGRPVTATIQGGTESPRHSPAPVPPLPPSPDALFNLTDGQEPFVAPGVVMERLAENRWYLAVDLRTLHVGSEVRLILRLVNNDFDRETKVTIHDLFMQPFDPSLNWAGSPPPALSVIPGPQPDPFIGPPHGSSLGLPECPIRFDDPIGPVQVSAGLFPAMAALLSGPPPQSDDGDTLVPTSAIATFTTTADFLVGTLFNLDAETIPDRLQLTHEAETHPFIWIANSGEGTMSKFDTRTGQEIGRYRTGPDSLSGQLSPSRTAVDSEGNAWVGNRAFGIQGSIVKVLHQGFVDRNGNGVVDTCIDVNGDGQIALDEVLPWDANGDGQPEDERIALGVPAGRSRTDFTALVPDSIPRATAIDADGNVWVGLNNRGHYEVYDGQLGDILAIVPTVGNPYGALVDSRKRLWCATQGFRLIEQIDTETRALGPSIDVGINTYGITIDDGGLIWASGWTTGRIARFDPESGSVNLYSTPSGETDLRGIGSDRQGNVWVASSRNNSLIKFSFATDRKTLLGTSLVAVGTTPTAAVLDSDGYIWTTTLNDHHAWKIDPTNNIVVFTRPTGREPYNYSDMTGRILQSLLRRGTWTEIVDSGQPDVPWAGVGVGSSTPAETAVTVRVRAADTRSTLESLGWTDTVSGTRLDGVSGRYLQVQVTLRMDEGNTSPLVQDITVAAALPPALTLIAPSATLPVGTSVLLTGSAIPHRPSLGSGTPSANTIQQVTLNGVPIESIDAAGNFFAVVNLHAGENAFIATATDAQGLSTSVTLAIEGADCIPHASSLGYVGGNSVAGEYARTSLRQGNGVIYAELAIRNSSAHPLQAPLYVGIRNLSSPGVRVLGADGVSADGMPFYDFSRALEGENLPVGQVTRSRTTAFSNPNREQFTYELVVLGHRNRPPAFITAPILEAPIGRDYAYDADAVDPDEDSVQYQLIQGPPGMTVDAASGRVVFHPGSHLAGTHAVLLRASDGRGGDAEQTYALIVREPPPNRPPHFVSVPLVAVALPHAYLYEADAVDPDGDPITYSSATEPLGMSVDPATGFVRWSPTVSQLGDHAVSLLASDSRGGLTRQAYTLTVLPDPANGSPIIVSTPVTNVVRGDLYEYQVEAIDPDGDTLRYSLLSATAGMSINPETGIVAWSPTAESVYTHSVGVRAEDGRGGSDEQHFEISVLDRPALPEVDLTIGQVDRTGWEVDPQTLAAGGTIVASITNLGPDAVKDSVHVLVFEDLDYDGSFNEGIDTVLGLTTVPGPLPDGENRVVSIPAHGFVTFPGTFIWAMVDPNNEVPETNKGNNVARNEVECRAAPPAGIFDPVISWKALETESVVSTPYVANLTDDNGDGRINGYDVPDVVVATHIPGAAGFRGRLVVLSGDDGRTQFSTSDLHPVAPYGELAIGDINGDGLQEIVAASYDGLHLLAFSNTGNLLWKSTTHLLPARRFPDGTADHGGAISIVNLDLAGLPEIVVGSSVYRADGSFIADGRSIAGKSGFSVFTSISSIGDVDLDGFPEIIAGSSVYRLSGEELILVWDRPDLFDGFTAIANFDDDPYAEVVLVSDGRVYMLNHDGTDSEIWNGGQPGGVSLPGAGPGGAPTIGDFNGDGLPEIGIADGSRYVVFRRDGSVLWSQNTHDATSGMTGSTAFDFDGDGRVEVLYRDERFLYVYSGINGEALLTLPMTSSTGAEYPVVADVDNDGRAEIIVTANRYAPTGGPTQSGVFVLRSATGRWVSARRIWNQHSYHISNVHDDGSIPLHEEPSWLTHNSYRLNAQPAGLSPHSAHDLTTSFLRLSGSTGVSTLTTRIGNGGELVVGQGVNVAFYDGDRATGGQLLGVAVTAVRIEPGKFEDVSVVVPGGLPGQLFVWADDDGIGGGSVDECDEANNEARLESSDTGEIHGIVFHDIEGDGRNGRAGELLQNGSFSEGNTGFFTEFRHTSDLWPASVYFIGTNPQHHHGGAASYGDHTTGGGLMMIVNGSTQDDLVLWQQSVVVQSDRTYEFSFWVSSWYPSSPASLRVYINDEEVGEECVAPLQTGRWQACYYAWNSGDFNTATIRIGNLELAGFGNDFAVDDFSFDTSANSEPGLGGWVVYLDRNGNGRRDTGERWTLTDSTGAFAFLGLAVGSYLVRQEVEVGWYQTAPTDGGHTVDLGVSEVVRDIDFGNRRIIAPSVNRAPFFTSTAVSDATAGEAFRYEPMVIDSDGDTLRFNLAVMPSGMAVHPNLGTVVWIPTTSQVGSHDVVLRVEDGRGGMALQTIRVRVLSANITPVITSIPVGPAQVGVSWQYQVRAQDSDGDAVVLGLEAGPEGMEMDGAGLVTWMPGAGGLGLHHVEVFARDSRGAATYQSFDLPVVAASENRPPQIVSRPRTSAAVDQAWLYEWVATDPDGDALSFELVIHPPGMSVGPADPPSAGARWVRWTPGGSQLGLHEVVVRVSDGRATVVQSFSVAVNARTENRPPAIVSIPPAGGTVDVLYAYDPVASDPDHDPIDGRWIMRRPECRLMRCWGRCGGRLVWPIWGCTRW